MLVGSIHGETLHQIVQNVLSEVQLNRHSNILPAVDAFNLYFV